MKEEFNEVINSVVKPLLKEAGFKKEALNFRKSEEELTFVINFQKSHGNYYAEVGFYVNCSIYCNDIANILGHEVIEKPQEAHGHFRSRIESISDKADSKFLITPETNLTDLKSKLQASLIDVLNYFAENIKNTEGVITQLIVGNGTYETFKIFRFCLRTNRFDFAQEIVKGAKTNMLKTNQSLRWEEDWRMRFLEIIEEEKSKYSFKELDFEQRTELDAEETKILLSNEESGQWGIEEKEFEHAIKKFEQCLFIIPEPKNIFKESTRIYTQLGYSYILNKDYSKAKKVLQFAMTCPNPDLKKIAELMNNCK